MEKWDLYDENRETLNRHHLRGDALVQGDYHIVIEVVTMNPDGKLLLTKRDAAKTYPLLWEFTGGSIVAGETSREGAIRELAEETSLVANADALHLLGEMRRDVYFLDSYIWKSREDIDVTALRLQAEEVCDARLVTWEEFEKMNQEGLVVPKVWERYKLYEKEIKHWMLTI